MWWWRLIVFAESARDRRILFLLSLENPCPDSDNKNFDFLRCIILASLFDMLCWSRSEQGICSIP